MASCFLCDKKVQKGQNVSHSHRRTKRDFKPNIFKKTLQVSGAPVKVSICAKCYKKQY